MSHNELEDLKRRSDSEKDDQNQQSQSSNSYERDQSHSPIQPKYQPYKPKEYNRNNQPYRPKYQNPSSDQEDDEKFEGFHVSKYDKQQKKTPYVEKPRDDRKKYDGNQRKYDDKREFEQKRYQNKKPQDRIQNQESKKTDEQIHYYQKKQQDNYTIKLQKPNYPDNQMDLNKQKKEQGNLYQQRNPNESKIQEQKWEFLDQSQLNITENKDFSIPDFNQQGALGMYLKNIPGGANLDEQRKIFEQKNFNNNPYRIFNEQRQFKQNRNFNNQNKFQQKNRREQKEQFQLPQNILQQQQLLSQSTQLNPLFQPQQQKQYKQFHQHEQNIPQSQQFMQQQKYLSFNQGPPLNQINYNPLSNQLIQYNESELINNPYQQKNDLSLKQWNFIQDPIKQQYQLQQQMNDEIMRQQTYQIQQKPINYLNEQNYYEQIQFDPMNYFQFQIESRQPEKQVKEKKKLNKTAKAFVIEDNQQH